MASRKPPEVSVPEHARKHLARNIPVDWSGYCSQIRCRRFPRGVPPIGRNRFVLNDYGRMISICFSSDMDEESQEFQSFVSALIEISVRYEALLVTVDQTVSPKPVYRVLERLKRDLSFALRSLDDESRDATVLELGGFDSIDQLPATLERFEGASSLAEKVTIARRLIELNRAQVEQMAGHFDYKRQQIGKGKPPNYAFAFAVFSLAEVFEEYDHLGRVANVVESATIRNPGWRGNYGYSGPFLEFATAFFMRHNPLQIQSHVASGFPNALRKMLQKRNKAPSLHRSLDDSAGPQEILDFMVSIDALSPSDRQ